MSPPCSMTFNCPPMASNMDAVCLISCHWHFCQSLEAATLTSPLPLILSHAVHFFPPINLPLLISLENSLTQSKVQKFPSPMALLESPPPTSDFHHMRCVSPSARNQLRVQESRNEWDTLPSWSRPPARYLHKNVMMEERTECWEKRVGPGHRVDIKESFLKEVERHKGFRQKEDRG